VLVSSAKPGADVEPVIELTGEAGTDVTSGVGEGITGVLVATADSKLGMGAGICVSEPSGGGDHAQHIRCHRGCNGRVGVQGVQSIHWCWCLRVRGTEDKRALTLRRVLSLGFLCEIDKLFKGRSS
jgi:hypothetical protein